LNQCPTCKAVLDPGVRFCPHDGTPLTETAAVGASAATPTGARPKSVELNLPVVVGGRYKLIEPRGGGGMAKVYKAEDLTLQRIVAVKLINPELRTEQEFDARFQREARIASQLQDPHIVAVHDFGLDPTLGPYLVMEYLEGQSLRERLQTGGPLPLKAGLQISGQLLLALTHAHEKGIVHRDIKPDNVFLVTQSGVRMHVRVLDFGIARILRHGEPGPSHTLTSPGAVLGTPRYMSPEQLAGQPIDARSDLFSAALVIHEALTGQLPYVSGKKLCELCPGATPALQELLEHCLKPAPADRPQTAVEAYLRMQEFAKASGVLLLPPGAIESILRSRKSSSTTVTPAPTEPYHPAAPATPRRRRMLIGLGIVLAVLAAAAWATWHFFRPVPRGDTLFGIRIGDGDALAEAKIGRKMHKSSWSSRPKDIPLGDVLIPDIDLTAMPDWGEFAWTDDRKVVLFFSHSTVVAIVVRAPYSSAVTGRGVRLGDDIETVKQRYDNAGAEAYVKTVGMTEVRRYDTFGIGFELEDDKVTSITLYPPAKR
jgi:serine/threonine-protein kinase